MFSIINTNLRLLYTFHGQEDSKEGRQSLCEHNRGLAGDNVYLNQYSEVLEGKIATVMLKWFVDYLYPLPGYIELKSLGVCSPPPL